MKKYLLTELGQARTGKYLALRYYAQTRWSRCTRSVSHDLGSMSKYITTKFPKMFSIVYNLENRLRAVPAFLRRLLWESK